MAWVREPSNLVSIGVKDYNGKTATTQYWVAQSEADPAAGAPAALAAAVAGISAGAVTSVQLLARATQSAPAAAATGPYDSVSDKLKLEFGCADGSKMILQLPGPLLVALKPDHYKADASGTAMAALILAMQTNATNAQGSLVTALSNGYRRVPPGLKKR